MHRPPREIPGQGDNPNITLARPHVIGSLTLSADEWRRAL